MTFTDSADEDPTKPVVGPAAQPAATDSVDESLTDKDGMRIAGEAFVRELVRYSGQAAVTFAIVGVIGYAGYWSVKEMRSLPAFLQAVAKPFMPPPPVRTSSSTKDDSKDGDGKRIAEDKPVAKTPVRKRFRHARRQLAARTPHRTDNFYTTSDQPTGGRIEYSDGVITQYSWNK